jgi:H+/Cl- antiporter ClcA
MPAALYLSFVTAAISYTVTETKLFRPLREWLQRKNSFLGELISCGYCFGFWVALVITIIYRPRLFDLWWPLDYLLTATVIFWLGGIQWAVMCWLTEKAGK